MYLSEGFGPSSLFKKKDGSCITITRARRAPRTSEGQARQGSQTVDARRGRDNMVDNMRCFRADSGSGLGTTLQSDFEWY